MDSASSPLVLDAPIGRHFAQLSGNQEDLVDAAGLFIETGLRRESGVAVIASATHIELFLTRLSQSDLHPETLRRSGQPCIHDAKALVTRFMEGDMPKWVDFRRTIGTALDEARWFGRRPTRVFSEMADILWRGGRAQAATRLEEYWNGLARVYPFSLFCGYTLDGLKGASYASLLPEIGQTHSDIILAPADDGRFRLV